MAGSRIKYQAIPIEDESGSKGADGTLSFYSRLIYFITKQKRLADLRRNRSKEQAKAQYKQEKHKEKDIYKKNAVEITKSSEKLARTIKVYRRQSGLGDKLKDADGVEALVMGSGATFMDFIITFFRSFGQVFANVWVNYWSDLAAPHKPDDIIGNDDRNNPDSLFNQVIYNNHGDPASGLSLFGYGSLGLSLLSPLLGIGRGLYQFYQKIKYSTLSFFDAQKKKVSAAEGQVEFNETELENQLHDRLKAAMKEKTLSVYASLPEQPLAADRKTFLDDMIDKVGQRYDASRALRITKTAVSTLWDRLSTFSYIFWLAWMPFVIACGLAAASGPMLPFVLLITLVIGTTFNVLKLVQLKKASEPKPADVVPDPMKAEFDRLAHEVKLLEFIDAESLGITNTLGLKNVNAKPRHAYRNSAAQSELRDRLLGSVHERRGRVVIAGFRKFIGGLLTVVFVGWLGSALIGYFGATAAADFIGGAPFGGIGGAIAGIFTSVVAMAQLRKQQLAYEQKVDTILQAPYRDTNETKADAFQRLYEQVEFRKSLIKKYLADNKAMIDRPAHFDELDDASKALFEQAVAHHKALKDYLAKVDVFNDRYFEKFEHEAGAFTWIKKGLNRVYEFIFASQTGAFTARFLLLKGGLLAGALGFSVFAAAAMWPFLIAAAVLMLVLGTVAVIDYQMKVNQEHRENFLNTLDARIYYLEKKNEELFAIQREHKVFHQHASELAVVEEALKVAPRPIADSDCNVEPDDAVVGSPDETPFVSSGDIIQSKPRSPDDTKGVSSGLQQAGFFADSSQKMRMYKMQLADRPVFEADPVLTAP